MKYFTGLLGLMLVATSTFSCTSPISTSDDEDSPIEKEAEIALQILKSEDFEIILIDDCEYLIFTESFNSTNKGFGFMAHKGNCSNPIHCFANVSDSNLLP